MPPRKRARNSSTSGSRSSETAVTTVELSGGWALSPELVQLWRSGRLTDTVVEVDGRSFAAHRVVLASACDYFNRHYDNEHMRGADHPKLLEHVTAAAFEPLLAFLYEGTCTFDESLLAPVLRAANYLNVAPLEKAAITALTERLSPSNALTAWTWGEELELPELAEAAKETALEGFDELEQIEQATLAQVQALVADDRLTAKSEEAVFSAVARFAEAKQPAEADLHGLLRNVRFPSMSEAFMLETVRKWPLLHTIAGKDLLVEMLAPLLSGPARQPRLGFAPRTLYVLGGHDSQQSRMSSIEMYDIQTASWSAGVPMPKVCGYFAAQKLGGKIYVLGGRLERDTTTNTVRAFDMKAGTWAEVASLTTPRRELTSATVGGKLYAIGGYDDDDDDGRRHASVEAFDPQTGVWTEVAPMPEGARDELAAAVLDGKIYVIGGGVLRGESIDSVEVYDPATNAWAPAQPMGTARQSHAAATLDGKIYVAGGEDDHGARFNSVEVFDPHTNTWAAVAPMSVPRAMFSLTAVHGKLYAVGGTSNGTTFAATAEAYDPQQNRWESIALIPTARGTHAAVAV